MPDDIRGAAHPGAEPSAGAGRAKLIAFVSDAASEAALREGFAGLHIDRLDIRRGNIRQATAAMQRVATPRVLLVDVSGEEQPLTALNDLAEVVEPDVRMLVVGDRQDMNFYRQLTRSLGVAEYLYKPLGGETVSRLFAPLVDASGASAGMAQGGRVLTVSGARGGVGATTIAANLAWHLAKNVRRHTVLLDPDLHTGSAAMLLNASNGAGLRMALEEPTRVDDLFLERAVQKVDERLHLLSSEVEFGEAATFAPGCADRLMAELRRRYNFVVVDLPPAPLPLYRELFDVAHQRVLVLTPTLAGVRDMLRLLALPAAPGQARRAMVVLNRVGQPGALTRKQTEDALGQPVDLVIANQPAPLAVAESLGTPAAVKSGSFRTAIIELAAKLASVSMAEGGAVKAERRWFGRRRARA